MRGSSPRGTFTTTAGGIATAAVLVASGVALAAPGLGTTTDDPDDAGLETVDEPAGPTVVEFCEEHPDAPFCRGPSEPQDLPGEGDDEDETGQETEDDLADDESEAESDGDDGENAQAFAAWVRSLPSDWGCIRGRLVSRAAQAGPLGDDFEALTFDSAAEAAEALGLEGRCVEVALAREAGEDEGPQDSGDDGRPGRGRPDHAGPPANRAGSDEAVGAGEGRPDGGNGAGGPPADAGRPDTAGATGKAGGKGAGQGAGKGGGKGR